MDQSLKLENDRLRRKLDEAEELIDAIRKGRVDALVMSTTGEESVYTLKGADHTYRVLIENMREGAVILSETGMILFCNRSFAGMIGLPMEKLIGSPIHDAVVPEERRHFQEELEQIPPSGINVEFMLRGPYAGVPVMLVLNRLPLDEETAICMLVFDLSERKTAEEALKKYSRTLQLKNMELERRADQLRRLASQLTIAEQQERKRVSYMLHDGLQQYLASAKMQLGFVSDQLQGDEVKELVLEVEKVLAESIDLTRSLSTELSPPILHVGGLVEGLHWLVRWMSQRYGFSVHLTTPTDELRLPEDVKVFSFEAVREMLFNAAKHSRVQAAEVHLAIKDGYLLEISVTDRGVGFDPRRLPLMESGKGFGLFSIRERVEFLKGRFDIDSAPGSGSRFSMLVPILPPPADGERIESSPEKSPAPRKTMQPDRRSIRVLVADDHGLFRDGLARILSREPDIEVIGHACDGVEAIDLARELMPDVILMDVAMPRVNGIEATRTIHRESPAIRIIGLSMYEDTERMMVMRKAGACDYRVKTCLPSELIAAVRGSAANEPIYPEGVNDSENV